MDWSIGSIHSSKLSFAAATVCPSTPAAERFGICRRFFCTLERVNDGETFRSLVQDLQAEEQ
jgi:hypothetical protein